MGNQFSKIDMILEVVGSYISTRKCLPASYHSSAMASQAWLIQMEMEKGKQQLSMLILPS